jgi:hypothetical protein
VYHLHPRDILLHPVGLELILLPVGQEVVDRVLQLTPVATDPRCNGQAASTTASLREVLKVGPLCRQRTLDAKKISAMALNSTYRERGTSLILYLGAVVMPRCSSRARSLPARTGALTPKDSTSSASRYIFSSSTSLEGGYSSLALSSISWSFGCYCSSAGKS